MDVLDALEEIRDQNARFEQGIVYMVELLVEFIKIESFEIKY